VKITGTLDGTSLHPREKIARRDGKAIWKAQHEKINS